MMRDKEVLEVLAVLDVVQNLDVFKARLAELREAQKALADQREVDFTLEEARKELISAQEVQDKAARYVEDKLAAVAECEVARTKVLDAREQVLAELEQEAHEARRAADAHVESVRVQLEANQFRSKALDDREASLAVQRKELESKEREHHKLKESLKALTNG